MIIKISIAMVRARNEGVTIWNTCVNPREGVMDSIGVKGVARAETQHDGLKKRPKV